MTVHVWAFRGKHAAWGHASMEVDGNYISWWPEGEGRIRSRLHPDIYAAHPFRYRTFLDDVRDEEQEPDQTILLRGLDEKAIKDWWQSFGLMRDGIVFEGPLQAWKTFKKNCSTVVAAGLTVGGARQYARYHKSLLMPWTPSDVLAYARAIRAGLAPRP